MVRFGVDCISHCDVADEEALDTLEDAKSRFWVGPALGLVQNSAMEVEPGAITNEMTETE